MEQVPGAAPVELRTRSTRRVEHRRLMSVVEVLGRNGSANERRMKIEDLESRSKKNAAKCAQRQVGSGKIKEDIILEEDRKSQKASTVKQRQEIWLGKEAE